MSDIKHDHIHIFTSDYCYSEDGEVCESSASKYCLLCSKEADDIAVDLQKELNKIMTNYNSESHTHKFFSVSWATKYLPQFASIKVSDVLVANMDKYPDEKWKTQTVEEHLTHMVEHVADYQTGNKDEDWLAKIVTRAAMAAWKDEN